MKKLLALVCCLSFCMAFTACKNDKTDSVSEKTTTTASQTTTTLIEQSQAPDPDKTVEDYIKENKESFDVFKQSMGGTGLELDISARENSLVYSHRYTFMINDIETVKETLEQGFESVKESYVITLDALKIAVPTAQSIILEYFDIDGNLITSCEIESPSETE